MTQAVLADVSALDKGIARRAGDVKRLQGIDPPQFRLRVGDYRVRFLSDGMTVIVLRVRNRREAYR